MSGLAAASLSPAQPRKVLDECAPWVEADAGVAWAGVVSPPVLVSLGGATEGDLPLFATIGANGVRAPAPDAPSSPAAVAAAVVVVVGLVFGFGFFGSHDRYSLS